MERMFLVQNIDKRYFLFSKHFLSLTEINLSQMEVEKNQISAIFLVRKAHFMLKRERGEHTLH